MRCRELGRNSRCAATCRYPSWQNPSWPRRWCWDSPAAAAILALSIRPKPKGATRRCSPCCWDSRRTTRRRRLEHEVRHIFCPEVLILEGTAASQAYAGTPPSSANLRYQYALDDTARECTLDGDQLAIKIGVAGKVLLGPAGSPGGFSVPVRMAVLREHDNQPIVSKLYRAAVTVAAGETRADFTIVSEPLRVPFIQDHAEDDYTIKVGIDEGASADKPAAKHAKP